jgi:epsilon-lactone hydrolase
MLAHERHAFERLLAGQPLPPDVHVDETTLGDVPARRVSPSLVHEGRALLFLHGGGYVMGSSHTHQWLAAQIAIRIRATAFVLDYRLAPEHPYPAALHDALSAYRALLAGTRPTSLALGGTSAGAGLALACLLAARHAGEPMPAAAVLMSPWVDLALTGPSIRERADRDPVLSLDKLGRYRDHYLAGANPTTPLASPLYGQMGGLPPLLIQVGTEEILYDDAARLAERLRNARIEARFEPEPGMTHAFQSSAAGPRSADAINRAADFLERRLWFQVPRGQGVFPE